jgi:hypothetical protein
MSSTLVDLRSARVFDVPECCIAVPRVSPSSYQDGSHVSTSFQGGLTVAARSSLPVWSTALYHIRTLYLFTASDYKTVVMPVVRTCVVTASNL